jgi:hypothetical protein
MSVCGLDDIHGGTPKYSEKYLFQCRSIRHKSHMASLQDIIPHKTIVFSFFGVNL